MPNISNTSNLNIHIVHSQFLVNLDQGKTQNLGKPQRENLIKSSEIYYNFTFSFLREQEIKQTKRSKLLYLSFLQQYSIFVQQYNPLTHAKLSIDVRVITYTFLQLGYHDATYRLVSYSISGYFLHGVLAWILTASAMPKPCSADFPCQD